MGIREIGRAVVRSSWNNVTGPVTAKPTPTSNSAYEDRFIESKPAPVELNPVALEASPEPDVIAPGELGKPAEPDPAREEYEYDYYRKLIDANGGTFDESPDARNLIAIRRPTDTRANGGKGEYDDVAVLVWKDDEGRKHVRSYKCNTEPTSQYVDTEQHTRDVNGDGNGELGRLPPGHYKLEHNWSLRKFITTGDGDTYGMLAGAKVEAEYDINRDGKFNDGATGPGGETMIWHQGDDENVNSAGCQTMPPDEFAEFNDDMEGAETIRYTLVNEDPAKGNVVAPPPPVYA